MTEGFRLNSGARDMQARTYPGVEDVGPRVEKHPWPNHEEHRQWAHLLANIEDVPAGERQVLAVVQTSQTHKPFIYANTRIKGGGADNVAGHKFDICAEQNALMDADPADPGDTPTIYIWPVPPCLSCGALIVKSGIKRVVLPQPDPDHPVLGDRWKTRWEWVQQDFKDAGVEVIYMPDKAVTP